jgi:branched-chain amino acid transport system substrate-binding protein
VGISVALAVAGCSDGGSKSDGAASAEPIKIGFLGTLTGGAADVGLTALEGVEIAVEELNAAGGVQGRKLEIVKKDEQLSPVATVKAMREFAQEGVKFITGFTSSADAIAAIPIAEQNGMVIVTAGATSTALTTTEFSKNLFEVASNTTMMNAAAAKLVGTEWKSVKEWQNVGFNYVTGHGSWDEFQKLAKEENPAVSFGKAVFYPLEGGQLGSYISSLVGTNPSSTDTGLFVSTFGGGAVTFAKQAQPYKLFDKYAVVANVGGGEELAAALGKDSPRIYYIHDYFYGAHQNPINDRLIEAWSKRDKVGPKTHGPHSWLYEGYTATMAFAQAIEQGKSADAADVLKTLPGMSFDTAMGKAQFRAEDHILAAPVSAVECFGDAASEFGYKCENAISVPAEDVLPEPNPSS